MARDARRTRTRTRAARRCRPRPEGLEARALLATLPEGFAEVVMAEGLRAPTAMDVAPDGRVFILEQAGAVRVVKDGALLPDPFATLDVAVGTETGLLGIALDPDFAANGHVFLYYTEPGTPARNRIARLTADGDTAEPGSLTSVFDLEELTYPQHVGGAIHFGSDGKLYVGVGDYLTPDNSQSLESLGGKLLRINPDGSIPEDNPFFNQADGIFRAIYAIGLRNPYTFAVQPGTGRIYVNDVGAKDWEEINEALPGANYGWPQSEGPTDLPGIHAPLFAYGHGSTETTGRAIAGGAFYPHAPDADFPADYRGDYFFADIAGRWIRRYDPETGAVDGFATGLPFQVLDLKGDAAGNLLYLARGGGGSDAANGSLARIDYDPPAPPPPGPLPQLPPPAGPVEPADPPVQPSGPLPRIIGAPTDVLVPQGVPVTFAVQAAGTGPLSYQWQRDGVDIPDATGPTYTIPSVAASDFGARFRVVVADANGAVASAPARLSAEALWIADLYRDLLGREPDREGWDTWILARSSGTLHVAIASGVLNSPERLAGVVSAAYRRYLGRDPEPEGLADWSARLASGMSEDALALGVIDSPEYRARQGGTDAGVVAALYRDVLGREATPDEVAGWSSRPPSAAIAGVLFSEEAARRMVSGWYLAYLLRAPSSDEVTAHAARLLSTRDRLAGRLAFVASPEYVNRPRPS